MDIQLTLRILIAVILGGLIGLEREYRAKEAGFRTHFLVALGSALFMVVSQHGFENLLISYPNISLDPSRIASQVVSGIGFIGAGTIIFQKHAIRGLTTAAGLWVTAAIGLASGAGMHIIATASTVMVLICLETLNYTTQHFGTRHLNLSFISPDKEHIEKILQQLTNEKAIIKSYKIHPHDTTVGTSYSVQLDIIVKRNRFNNNILTFMSQFEGITVESIE